MKIGEEIYKATQTNQAADGTSTNNANTEGPIDAEIVE
jgi:hypothetical protein